MFEIKIKYHIFFGFIIKIELNEIKRNVCMNGN